MRVWLALLLAVGGTTVSGFAQTNTQAVNQSDPQRRLDERAPIWLKAFNVTGIGIAYIENGKIAWTAYGDQVPRGPLANQKTLYSVASLTKTITADIYLAVGIGWEAIFGRIDCRILDRS
jgi:CubicO group peptidase (beta-lactamase class C family)